MVFTRSFSGNGRHCTSQNANLSASASQMSAIACSASRSFSGSPVGRQIWHKEINWNQDENRLLVFDFPVFGVEGFRVFRSV